MTTRVYVSNLNDIVWHPRQKYTYLQYKKALDGVFDTLFFTSAQTRFNLIGSYRMNLKNLVLYALANNIDEIEYIKSLRDVLLQDEGCFEITR